MAVSCFTRVVCVIVAAEVVSGRKEVRRADRDRRLGGGLVEEEDVDREGGDTVVCTGEVLEREVAARRDGGLRERCNDGAFRRLSRYDGGEGGEGQEREEGEEREQHRELQTNGAAFEVAVREFV